jgi:hypothetical protein
MDFFFRGAGEARAKKDFLCSAVPGLRFFGAGTGYVIEAAFFILDSAIVRAGRG